VTFLAGDIYLGINIISGEEVTINLKSVKPKHRQLEKEHLQVVLASLLCAGSVPNVIIMRWSSIYWVPASRICSTSATGSFPQDSPLADQLVCRCRVHQFIKYIHSHNFIHKPNNFLMGIGKCGNQVNVIDLGLAKKYREPKTHLHIPYRENKNLTGTARYTSINTHLQARCDDLESLAYVNLLRAHCVTP
jgi:casein kinase I homolog HRR25